MQLYYAALVLPDALNEKIRSFKEWMRDRFGCRVGLKSPAHITVLPPYWMQPAFEAELQAELAAFAATQSSFEVFTKGFSSFKTRTLFIDVEADEALRHFKKACDDWFVYRPHYGIKPGHRPFHPHITIATRDIPKGAFAEAWAHFAPKPFAVSWRASELSLLRHNGRAWDVLSGAPFGDVKRQS